MLGAQWVKVAVVVALAVWGENFAVVTATHVDGLSVLEGGKGSAEGPHHTFYSGIRPVSRGMICGHGVLCFSTVHSYALKQAPSVISPRRRRSGAVCVSQPDTSTQTSTHTHITLTTLGSLRWD